jgi:hypothetical protein
MRRVVLPVIGSWIIAAPSLPGSSDSRRHRLYRSDMISPSLDELSVT